MKLKYLITPIFFTVACAAAQANLISYEGFNYSTSNSLGLDEASGGSGWASDWGTNTNKSGENTYAAGGGLSYSGLAASVGVAGVGGSFDGSVRQWSATDVTSGSFFVSFLYKDPLETAKFFFRMHPATSLIPDGGNMGFGVVNGEAIITTGWVTELAGTGSTLSGASTHLIVAKVDLDADTVSLWVNQLSEGTADVTHTFGSDISAQGKLTPYFLANNWVSTDDTARTLTSVGTAEQTAFFDEVRVGNSFSDVTPVPEPATFAMLMGAVVLGLGVLRRRKVSR